MFRTTRNRRSALVLGLIMGLAWFAPGRWDVPGTPAQAISDSVWQGHWWTIGFFLTLPSDGQPVWHEPFGR